jgi:hypothetical protein
MTWKPGLHRWPDRVVCYGMAGVMQVKRLYQEMAPRSIGVVSVGECAVEVPDQGASHAPSLHQRGLTLGWASVLSPEPRMTASR